MDRIVQFPVRSDWHRWEAEKTWKSKGRSGYLRKWMTLWRCVRCGRRARQDYMVNRRKIGPLDAPPGGLFVFVDQKPYLCGEFLVRDVMES